MREEAWFRVERAIKFGGTLQFEGSYREQAEAVLTTAAVLRERIMSGGVVTQSYEDAGMPRDENESDRGFGGWLETAVPQLHSIERVLNRTINSSSDRDVRVWVSVRRSPRVPYKEVAQEAGVSVRRARQIAEALDRRLGMVLSSEGGAI